VHVHTSCSRNRRSVPSLSHRSGLRFANVGPQPPLFLSSGGLPAANLLQTLRGLAIALVTGTRRVNSLKTVPRPNTLPKSGFSTPVRRICVVLTASHGRSCSPGIRPIGCSTAARAFFIEAPHDRRPPSSANVAHALSDAGTLRLCRLRFSRNPDYTESGGPPLKETAGKETQKEIQWMEALRRKQAVAGAAGKETGLNRWRSPRC